jgi:NTP pyrophosphatase (non-canonical NTP hydrolase)
MYCNVEPVVSQVRDRFATSQLAQIPDKPDLPALQKYITQVVHARGFQDESVRDVVLLFVEEVGELAKAVRTMSGLKVSGSQSHKAISDELADCLIYLLDLANLSGVNLETALRDKEEANSKKTWVRIGES